MDVVSRIFFLYGNTCAGQNTLGMKLAAEIGFKYISFGDLKRIEVANGTDIGKELECRIKNREPIIPEISAILVVKHITDGYNIISGYPISREELESLLRLCYCKIEGVIVLKVAEGVIPKRFFGRRVCPICQFSGREGERCIKHNTLLTKRSDCNEKELSHRLCLYRERIKPFLRSGELDSYPRIQLDTSDLSPQEIFNNVRDYIISLQKEVR